MGLRQYRKARETPPVLDNLSPDILAVELGQLPGNLGRIHIVNAVALLGEPAQTIDTAHDATPQAMGAWQPHVVFAALRDKHCSLRSTLEPSVAPDFTKELDDLRHFVVSFNIAALREPDQRVAIVQKENGHLGWITLGIPDDIGSRHQPPTRTPCLFGLR